MIGMLLAGAIFGGGCFLVIRGLFPPRPSLADALAHLRQIPEPEPLVTERDGGFAARIGRPVAGVIIRDGATWLVPARVRRDIAVTERSVERHLAEQVALFLIGLRWVPINVLGRTESASELRFPSST